MKNWLNECEPWTGSEDFSDYFTNAFIISSDEDQPLRDVLESFLECEGAEDTVAILLDDLYFGDYEEAVDVLVQSASDLLDIRGIGVGKASEYTIDEINQCDLSSILDAFPGLEQLEVYGGNELTIDPVRHICLEKLSIVSNGLGPEILPNLSESVLQQLNHLEVWLGAGVALESVETILSKEIFPDLSFLALKNTDLDFAIIEALAKSSILQNIKVLDLSLSHLSDRAGAAIVESIDRFKSLSFLHLAYHNFSDATCEAIRKTGLKVNLDNGGARFSHAINEDRYDEIVE